MIDADELPEGWVLTTVEVIAEVIGGGTPDAADTSNFEGGTIPWITPADLTGYDRPTIGKGRRNLTAKGLDSSSAKLLPLGSVLFSSRAPIGYCVIAENELATNQGFKNLALRGGIDPRYVRHYLLGAKDYISSLASGTTFPELSAARMKQVELPLPPLNEQRRIVERIEALQACSRSVREALELVPLLLEQYRQSVLLSAFRGDLTADWRERYPDVEPATALLERIRQDRRRQWEAKHQRKKYIEPEPVDDTGLPKPPEGWAFARADEVVAPGTVITYGIVLPGDPLAEGVPYVRGQDIEDGRILVDQLWKTSPEIAAKHERSSLREGDVLLCIIRHLKVAIVPAAIDGANLTQGTVRLRPSAAIAGPYLAAYLSGPTAQAWMKERYFGMAMPRINVEDARAIPVPVAPIEEQWEIVRRIEACERRRRETLVAVNQALDELGSLDQSILVKAFRGELLSQDPTDEPVSVLLERLRRERELGTNGSSLTPRRRRTKST
ncbi:MAG: restriction modification system specificity domain [Gemmataceae bacterium]|nr:restriction modification system specificity domain [Gemmataceae bacterium]